MIGELELTFHSQWQRFAGGEKAKALSTWMVIKAKHLKTLTMLILESHDAENQVGSGNPNLVVHLTDQVLGPMIRKVEVLVTVEARVMEDEVAAKGGNHPGIGEAVAAGQSTKGFA